MILEKYLDFEFLSFFFKLENDFLVIWKRNFMFMLHCLLLLGNRFCVYTWHCLLLLLKRFHVYTSYCVLFLYFWWEKISFAFEEEISHTSNCLLLVGKDFFFFGKEISHTSNCWEKIFCLYFGGKRFFCLYFKLFIFSTNDFWKIVIFTEFSSNSVMKQSNSWETF